MEGAGRLGVSKKGRAIEAVRRSGIWVVALPHLSDDEACREGGAPICSLWVPISCMGTHLCLWVVQGVECGSDQPGDGPEEEADHEEVESGDGDYDGPVDEGAVARWLGVGGGWE
jgi:hypothetical protein